MSDGFILFLCLAFWPTVFVIAAIAAGFFGSLGHSLLKALFHLAKEVGK